MRREADIPGRLAPCPSTPNPPSVTPRSRRVSRSSVGGSSCVATPSMRHQVQKEQLAAWEAALRGSGAADRGPRRRERAAALRRRRPLAPAIPGEAELADLWLVERRARWTVRAALEESLPAGSTLVDLYDVWLGEPALPGQVVASVYRARLSGPAVDAAAIEAAAGRDHGLTRAAPRTPAGRSHGGLRPAAVHRDGRRRTRPGRRNRHRHGAPSRPREGHRPRRTRCWPSSASVPARRSRTRRWSARA